MNPVQRRRSQPLLGSVWFGLAAVACGPSTTEPVVVPPDAATRYAEAMCHAYEHCGCLGKELEDVAACRSYSAETFRLVESWPDVRFNEECFEDFLQFLESPSCESGGAGLDGLAKCDVFEGTVAPGEACTPFAQLPANDAKGTGALGDEVCAEKLSCILGRCQSNRPSVGLGESCWLDDGVLCSGTGDQNLYCAPDGLCHEEVGSGQPCDSPFACGVRGEMCRGITRPGDVGVCGAPVALGEPCDQEEADACEPGAWCGGAGVCEPWRPVVCELLTPASQLTHKQVWLPRR